MLTSSKPRAILEAVLAIETSRAASLLRPSCNDDIRAALDAELRLGRGEHLVPEPEAAMLRNDEELVDLGGEPLVLEAEHVHRQQVARGFAVHRAIQARPG